MRRLLFGIMHTRSKLWVFFLCENFSLRKYLFYCVAINIENVKDQLAKESFNFIQVNKAIDLELLKFSAFYSRSCFLSFYPYLISRLIRIFTHLSWIAHTKVKIFVGSNKYVYLLSKSESVKIDWLSVKFDWFK